MYGDHGYGPICGLYYDVPSFGRMQQAYLPQVEVKVHASILATTSRTSLKQTFINPSTSRGIREVRYAFPLYDGVSVVGFSCQVGNRTITGEVKEKQKAKEVYRDAVARGETAGLLEQLPEASDVFTTTIGNIPPGARVVVNITYLGELKHDMEVDGIRFTIPTRICPRYGKVAGSHFDSVQQMDGTISITVDAEMAEGSFIQKLQSPSHPISMSMGTTSVEPDAAPSMSKASATLSLDVAHLETDFVLQVIAKDTGTPKAILETHPTISNHRALMATLVPKFALPAERPEIVFVCDQSGSMRGSRINLATEALQVFLKSLPVGVKFNICSFGSYHSFLWPRSVTYGQDTLSHAVQYAKSLQAGYGGTEMLAPLSATIENRYKDMSLNIVLLTDGEIWNQQDVFDELNEEIQENKAPIRVFTLGIGSGVSHSLIEGIAKAGNGFSQTVQEGEKMNSKVVRMLKGALSPHVNDYTLEVKYAAAGEEDGFELVEKVADSLKVKLDLQDKDNVLKSTKSTRSISLFDTSADLDAPMPSADDATGEDRYAHLQSIPAPKILQAPQSIPSLFAFNRTTIYLLLGPSAPRATPTSVILRGTSAHGPLELEIPIQTLDTPSEMIHQLAAKKAVSELEQGRGWLACTRDADGQLLNERFEGRFSDMVEREAVRLGVQFQVGGKWCSFVATEKTSEKGKGGDEMEEDWEYLEDAQALEQEQMQQRQYRANMQQQQFRASMQQQQYGAKMQLCAQQQQQFVPQGLQNSPVRPQGSSLFSFSSPAAGSACGAPAAPELFNSGFGGFSSYTDPASMSGKERCNRSRNIAKPAFGSSSTTSSLFGGASLGQMTSPTGGGLFGAATALASEPAFGASTSANALSPSPVSHAGTLQDYQMQLMLLEQQNKKRRLMHSEKDDKVEVMGFGNSGEQSTAPVADSSVLEQDRFWNYNDTALENFDFDAFLHTDEDTVLENLDFDAFFYTDKSSTQRLTKQAAAKKAKRRHSSELNRDQCEEPTEGDSAQGSLTLPTNPHLSPEEILTLLIDHQSFSGSFPYTTALLGLLGISYQDFNLRLRENKLQFDSKNRDLLFTALVVVYIERTLSALKGEWELVVEKARDWLKGPPARERKDKCMGADVILREAGKLVGNE